MSWWDRPLFEFGETPVTMASVLVLLVTLLVSAALARAIRLTVIRVLRGTDAGTEGRAYAAARIAEYLVFGLGCFVGLENVGVSMGALAAAGAFLSVGIGFGLQDIARNFLSGIVLLVERPVAHGDVIQVGDTLGTVEEIGLRATRITTLDGVSVIVPNSRLIGEEVQNLHGPTPDNRLRVLVGVAYGSDLRQVREVLLRVAEDHGLVLPQPAPYVFFNAFGDSSLDFELAVWIKDAARRPIVASELRFMMEAKLRANAISIPFPQRDVHVIRDLEGAGGPSGEPVPQASAR